MRQVCTSLTVLLCGAAAAALSATHAQAQEAARGTQLEEIVVTAERRTSDVQRTAASVTVRGGDELQAQGKFSLGEILQNVPGVAGGASSGVGGGGTDTIANGVNIRGVVSNGGASGQNLSGVPATAIFVDDVYNGVGGTYDIERVEVLRGPQGTLYGRSATAGVIAIHTRNPNLTELGGEVTAEVGNYDLRHATAILNLPLVKDQLAVRVGANHYERDGYVSAEGGAVKTTEAKIKVLFRPNDRVSFLAGAAYQENKTRTGGLAGNLTASNGVRYVPQPIGEGEDRFVQAWAQLDWDLGPATLTYIPALRSWRQNATAYPVGPGGAYLAQTQNTPDDDFITHELRLASDTGGRFSWQTGLFYYFNDISTSNYIRWASSRAAIVLTDAQRDTRDIGVFGEGTFRLTDAFRLTLGLRYDETTVQTTETYTSNINALMGLGTAAAGLPETLVSARVSGAAGRREFENVTYKLRAEYDLTAANLLYASATSGFLPGDVQINVGAGNLPTPSVYESETLKAYEVGTKNRFLDGRLQINGSLFYYDYGGFQTSIASDPSNPATTQLFSVPMRMTGGEAELLFQVTAADRVGLNVSHTKTRFTDAPAAFKSAVSGSELWGFPPTTATASYDHEFSLAGGSHLNLRGEVLYQSGYEVTSISPLRRAQGGGRYIANGDTTQLNLTATWSSADDRYSVSAYVRNATDETYRSTIQLQTVTPLLGAATESPPQTIGVVLNAKF